jgi:hypothetical protein
MGPYLTVPKGIRQFRTVPFRRWLGPVRHERDRAAGVGRDGVETGGMTPF